MAEKGARLGRPIALSVFRELFALEFVVRPAIRGAPTKTATRSGVRCGRTPPLAR